MQVLRSIKPAKLYVHCDGPRANKVGEFENTEKVRAIILDSIDWPCELKTFFRQENLGLRGGVYDAINWFFGQEEKGIILEDDCQAHPDFFNFCTEMLQQYAEDQEVMHIGGSNLLAHYTRDSCSYLFSRFSFVWGWASWRRAWEHMKINLDNLDAFVERGDMRHFGNRQMQAYMIQKFYDTQSGKTNSWAYAWFFSILDAKGLCIVSAENLVENTGVGDVSATHTRNNNRLARQIALPLGRPIVHPAKKIINSSLETRFFFRTQKSRVRLFLWYILYRVGLR
jgi:hypothetical protein